jgi:hypothetical protein
MIADLELRTWQRVRRYAVPAGMIERCTERRLAGDWRGACAAARVDITFSDAEARAFQAELSVLAPDLLRWHLPRALGGRTSLATNDVWVLSTAERIGEGDRVLAVRLPKTVDGSQRSTLEIGENAATHYDLPPYLWSVEHVDGLREAFGGAAVPWPLDEGQVVRAWRAAGIDLDLDPQAIHEPSWFEKPKLQELGQMPINLAGLAAEARRLARRYGTRRIGMYVNWRLPLAIEVDGEGNVRAALSKELTDVIQRRRIGEAVSRRPADPELVRHGLITPGELHPLVRSVLSPDSALSVAGGLAAAGNEPAAITSISDGPVRVRCRGRWHEIEHRDGRLVLASHSDEEVRREQALRGLGGKVAGCFAVQQAWTGRPGRLPRALRLRRRDILQRILHGDAETVLRMLDDGLDPHMRDGRGASLLHHLRGLDHTVLLPRLLQAGLEIDVRDRRGRTPLHVAVGDCGTPELVLALLEAGADPHAADGDGRTVLKLAHRKTRPLYLMRFEGNPVDRIHTIVSEWARR